MLWLIVAITAYLILSLVSLGDKFLLVSHIPSPRVYTFYIGILQVFALALIPFINFLVPSPFQIFLAIVSGACFLLGLFWFFKGLQIFEASRVVPAVGGALPLFIFFLVLLFSQGQDSLNAKEFLAFILLILGSIFITYNNGAKKISLKTLEYAGLAAGFLALYFVLAKHVYLEQSFWSGFIWIKLGGLLMSIIFLIFFGKEIKKEIFQNFKTPKKSSLTTTVFFFLNQLAGAAANILQNWAIALAPLTYVAIVSALQGVQYVFLLIFTIFLSLKFPQIFKEQISKKILLQKIVAIFLIGGGLAILALQ